MASREKRRMRATAVAILLLLSPAAGAEESVFALEEVATCDLIRQMPAWSPGHAATCSQVPDPGVRAYPALKSDKPVYGSAQFGSFFEERNPALLYHFVADESGGPGSGYDRLYVDLDGDKDLSNDAPVSPRKDVPAELLLRYTNIVGQVLFEDVGIPLPFGSDGLRPLAFTPRLLSIKGGSAMFSFVPATVRRGRIEIEGRRYDVVLGQEQPICGWFDHPETAFCLTPQGQPGTKSSSPSFGVLMTMPRLGETYYHFAATPGGDKLIVRPYEGPLGDFEVGGGSRFKTADLAVAGSLRSRDALVHVRGPTCRLPAGDYLLHSLTVSHEGLQFTVGPNYHSDGGFRSKLRHVPNYPIRIREGERFALDFSNRPQIVFADPRRDYTAKPGELFGVEAVLADPVLDFVVSNFSYTPSDSRGGSAEQPKGSIARGRDTILNPRVTISRSNGEVVSEGIMHYG